MNKIILASSVSLLLNFALVGVAGAVIILPPPPALPTTVGECKKDGWRDFGDMFKNQGDCVSFVATGGRNAPDGPANH